MPTLDVPGVSSRRTRATTGTKPRVASSQFDNADYLDPNDEVQPQDSVSNAPQQGTALEHEKANDSYRYTKVRRNERTNVIIKDTLQVRSQSPIKPSSGGGPSDRTLHAPKNPLRETAYLGGDRDLAPGQREKSLLRKTSTYLSFSNFCY